jgi:hypothetical protein
LGVDITRSPSFRSGCRRHRAGGAPRGHRDRRAITTIAPRTAIAIAIATASAAPVIAARQNGRRLILVLLDPDGNEAQDIVAEPHLALHLRHRGRRCVDVHQRIVGLAVLPDAEGEGTNAPVLNLADGSAIAFDNGFVLLGHRLDLLGRDILARQEHMLVERHENSLSFVVHGPPPAQSLFEASGKAFEQGLESGDTGSRADYPAGARRQPSVQPPAEARPSGA